MTFLYKKQGKFVYIYNLYAGKSIDFHDLSFIKHLWH